LNTEHFDKDASRIIGEVLMKGGEVNIREKGDATVLKVFTSKKAFDAFQDKSKKTKT
jgi:hypothetical protein